MTQPEPLTPPLAPPSAYPPVDNNPPSEKLTERPHPLTPLIRGWVIVLAILFSASRDLLQREPSESRLPPMEVLLAGVGGIVAIAVVVAFVGWRFTEFIIDADELRVDTGMLQKQSRRVAFDKVQAIDVVQPLAARMFGLAELQIDVGGSERVRLRYLKLTRAYAVRNYLLARARGRQVEASAEVERGSVFSDLQSEDEVLVRVQPQTLLLAALTSHEFFGILAGGIAMVVVGSFFPLGWGWLAIALPLASTLFGFVSHRVTGQFNYTLSRREHGLRISRGLTSLTSQSLPSHRIQAVQLSQSPLWRGLGLYRIDVEVIGWGRVSGDEDGGGVNTIMLPAGGIDQVRTALTAIWPDLDFEAVELQRAPARAHWRYPFAAGFQRWGHDSHLVVTRHGWLVRRWQLVPIARTQSVRISQGPLQRTLRLAELEFHTAGGSVSARARGVDSSAALAAVPELLALLAGLHDRPFDPAPIDAEPEAPPAEEPQAGPDAFRADQAEATISSTE